MWTIKSIIILSFILFINNIIAQDIQLNKAQMLQDFDEVVEHINLFAPHKDINAIKLGIDYAKEYKKLRGQITESTSICDFKDILKKTTNLVQDFHCSFLSYNYLSRYGKYQIKLNFEDDDTYSLVKRFDKTCSANPVNLKLPLLYTNGKYYVYSDFEYKNEIIKSGNIIEKINAVFIDSYIQDNYASVWPIRWDQKLKKPYHNGFYKFGDDNFKLTIRDKGVSKEMSFNLQDSIRLIKKKQREINYFSQPKEQILYFEDSGLLYVGLPFMDLNQAQSIVRKIDSLRTIQKTFSKIAIDVRGNPGGSDQAWRTVLGHLISENIRYPKKLMFKDNQAAQKFYNDSGQEAVSEKISVLDKKKYWSKQNDTITLTADTNSIKHNGNIYILQDEYIYSSTGNLSNLCLNSENLISVGTTNDFVGGTQTEPLFKKLTNSEQIFRVEPMLDFSDINQFEDLFHNEVEIRITPTIEDYHNRTTYPDNIYGEKFLLSHDKLIKYVIDN